MADLTTTLPRVHLLHRWRSGERRVTCHWLVLFCTAQPGGNMATTQEDTIAELQRTVAALQEKLDAALAQRSSEYGERIEHQAATLDVLKAMSASPGDPQPVFDLIARQAAKLCDVPTAAVATFDGTMVHLATQSGFDAAYADTYMSGSRRPGLCHGSRNPEPTGRAGRRYCSLSRP